MPCILCLPRSNVTPNTCRAVRRGQGLTQSVCGQASSSVPTLCRSILILSKRLLFSVVSPKSHPEKCEMKRRVLVLIFGGCLVYLAAYSFAHQIDRNDRGGYDWEPLLRPARNGDVSELKALLAEGRDVNTSNEFESTAIMFAAANGNSDCVKVLLDAHANFISRNFFGETALERFFQLNAELSSKDLEAFRS